MGLRADQDAESAGRGRGGLLFGTSTMVASGRSTLESSGRFKNFEYITNIRAPGKNGEPIRLFEWYVNFIKGPLFIRIGRQNLSWGETDGFRLLDQINPLDNNFGGFLTSLG